ncbi:putative RNA methyltransferase [Gongronella butleri]|nr:putative RNA methyltransferase [Gongronella butleri]
MGKKVAPKRKQFDRKLAGPEQDKDSIERAAKKAKITRAIPVGKPRAYTVSVAVPSSVVAAAPTLDLRTILAGQIGRALSIHSIDEIVIYDDQQHQKHEPGSFLARVLQYMETPQYMRKALVPVHNDLKAAGLLPLLEAPHHPRVDDTTRFREGVTVGEYRKEGGSLVDVGCYQRAHVPQVIQSGVRVTVELTKPIAARDTKKGQPPMPAKVISPKTIPQQTGLYWGYTIRVAESLSQARSETTYKDGYDLTIGVSDISGENVQDAMTKRTGNPFKHLLVVFGAPGGGLEEAIDSDENLRVSGEDAKLLFDELVMPNQHLGTRSLRLEESLTLVMSTLQPMILKHGQA